MKNLYSSRIGNQRNLFYGFRLPFGIQFVFSKVFGEKSVKLVMALVLFLCMSSGAFGQTTWYTIASGKWTDPQIWTLDPAGSVPINPSSLYPNLTTDNIVVRTGVTVAIPDGLTPYNSPLETKNNLNCGSLTVNGDLDFGVSTGHTFTQIKGNGRIYFESNNFPTANWSNFVTAGVGGGTIILKGITNFAVTNLPATVYNLEINNSDKTKIYTLDQSITVGGSLTVESGVLQINSASSTTVRNLTVNGNVNIKANGQITTGTTASKVFHWMNVYGDFTNSGVVDLSNSAQYAEATNGAVKLKFLGGTNNNMVCNGTTDLYRLFVDKGTDQTYTIAVNASSSANFKLFGPVSGTTSDGTDGANGWQRLPIVLINGNLQLESNISLSRLGENINGSGQGIFTIPSSAQFTINGANITTSSIAGSWNAITIYGKLKIESGTFTTTAGTNGIYYTTDGVVTPVFEITGGDVYATQLRDYNSSSKFQYLQSGGTIHFNARGNDIWSNPVFYLPATTHIFDMSGGVMEYSIANTNNVTGIYINSSKGNYNVTGGTVNVKTPSTNDFRICTSAPFNNLIVDGNGSANKVVMTNLYGSDNSFFYGDLNINKDVTITNSGVLEGRVYNLYVSGNMTINSGSSFTQTSGSASKLIFNGARNSVLTNQNATALSIGDLEINKEIYSPSTQFYTVSLAGSTGGFIINDSLRVIRGKLDVVNYNVDLKKNLEIVDGDLTSSGTGSIIFSGTAQQTLKGAEGVEQNFGRLQLRNTTGVKLLSNVNANTVVFNADVLFDLDVYNLDIESANYTSGSWGTTRMFKTAGTISAGGLTLPIVLNTNYGANTNVQCFPIGTFDSPGGSTLKYNPAYIDAKGTLNNSGKITFKPINDYHPTINPSRRTNATPYYWKASYSGLTGITAADIRYRFTYSGTVSGTLGHIYNNYDWFEYSSVISGNTVTFPYSIVSLPTYLTEAYTIGDTKVFDKPRVLYSIKTGVFDDKSIWSETSHTGTATNKSPNAADYCIIGGTPGVNHTVTLTDNDRAAQIYIKGNSETGNSGTPPTLIAPAGVTGDAIDVIDGKGRLVYVNNLGYWGSNSTSIITGDHKQFCSNTEAILEFSGTGAYYMPTLAAIPYYPNLHFTGASVKNTPYNGSVKINGNLYLDNSSLTVTNVYAGKLTIDGNLLINSGTLDLSGDATHDTYVDGSIIFSGSGTLKSRDNGGENKLYLKGNVVLINGSTIDFSTTSRKTDVVFYGDNNATVSRTGTGTTNLYRTYINKPFGKKVQFTTTFSLNGPTDDATKSLVLQSGECHLNNSGITIPLSTSGNPFKIPAGAILRVDNGSQVNVGGSTSNTGIWLDGALIVDNGSKVNCNQGSGAYLDNYLEYSPSGTASIWLGANAQLLVGSQLRRTTSSDAGILRFTQAKASSVVTLGSKSAPTSNRGVFEVLNGGSAFKQLESGCNVTIVRGQTAASVPALIFNPDTVSITTGSQFTLGNATTPASQNMGIYSGVELKDLTIGSTNTPTITVKTGALTLGGNLINGGTLNAAGYDVILKGNFTNNGTFTPAGNTTWFSGVADQLINGTNPVAFYNLTKLNSSTLTMSSTVNVAKDLTIGVPSPSAMGGTINTGVFDLNVARNLTVNGTTFSSGASKGVVCNGTALQQLSGNATFARLYINNANGLDVPTQSSPINFTEWLHLEQGVFNIGKNLITFDNDATITPPAGGYSSSCMIQTNLSFTDNGIRKMIPQGTWSVASPYSFVYPIGSAGKYTPINLMVVSNTGSGNGTIRVKAANERHVSIFDDPATPIDETKNVLQYNWTMDATGISGFTGTAWMNFIGSDALVTAPNDTSQYISARILLNSTSWNKFDVNDFDGGGKKVIFKFSGTDDSGIDGDYTAGISNCIPDVVPAYISVVNGPWSTASTWALYDPVTLATGAAGVGVPAGGPRGAVVYINSTVTMPNNYMAAYRTYINKGAILSTGTSFAHRLGDVYGQGTLQMQSGNLPAGVYDNFFSINGGTLEYTGTSDYSILSEVTSLNNLILSGSGQRNLPNIGFAVLGNLTLAGADCKNPHNTNITVNGNIKFTAGTFDANTSTVNLNGTVSQVISGTTTFKGTNAFYNLAVNNSAGIIDSVAIDVSNILTLTNGVVNTDAANLTLTNTSPNAFVGGSSSSFVDGPLYKQINNSSNFSFPVGDGGRYGLIDVATNSASQGLWRAQYYNHSPATDSYTAKNLPVVYVSANEYWSVTSPSISSVADVTARLDDVSGVNPSDPNSLFVNYAAAKVSPVTPEGWTKATATWTGDMTVGTAKTVGATFAGFSGVGKFTFGASTIAAYTWEGDDITKPTDWFTAANWYGNIVPSASSNVIIANVTNKPIVSGSTVAQTNNLTISSGATLTLAAGSQMTIEGALNNTGTLVIQNAAPVMSSLKTNGTISQTGAGTTRVESTFAKDNTRYWYYGFSINGASVTSDFWKASDAINVGVFKFTGSWTRLTDNVTALSSNPLSGVLNGYSVKLKGSGSAVLSATGALNNGDVSTTMPASSWSLLCNPYPSALDMSVVYTNSQANYGATAIDPTYWVPTNSSGALAFSTYNLATGIGQNGGSKILSGTQAFWAKNNGVTSKTYSLFQAARVHSTVNKLKSLSQNNSEPSDVFRMEAINTFATDEAVIAFRTMAYNVDSEKKLCTGNAYCNLYSIKESQAIAINVMPSFENETLIPLGLTVGSAASGDITLKAANLSDFDSNIQVWLEDKATGETVNLRELNEVVVNVSSGNIIDRFILHFNPAPVVVVPPIEVVVPPVEVVVPPVDIVVPPVEVVPDDNPVVTSITSLSQNDKSTPITIVQIGNDVKVGINVDTSIDAQIEVVNEQGVIVTKINTKMKETMVRLPRTHSVYIVRVMFGKFYKSSRVIAKGN